MHKVGIYIFPCQAEMCSFDYRWSEVVILDWGEVERWWARTDSVVPWSNLKSNWRHIAQKDTKLALATIVNKLAKPITVASQLKEVFSGAWLRHFWSRPDSDSYHWSQAESIPWLQYWKWASNVISHFGDRAATDLTIDALEKGPLLVRSVVIVISHKCGAVPPIQFSWAVL